MTREPREREPGTPGVAEPFWQVVVNPDTVIPPSEQIHGVLATMIGSGELAAGDRLPTVRALADYAGVAVNTVAKAYRQLSAEGLVVGHSRAGTVVAESGHSSAAALERAAAAYAARAVAAGLSDDAAVDLISASLRNSRA